MALSKSEQQEIDELNFIYDYPSLRNKIDVLVSYALDVGDEIMSVYCDSDFLDEVMKLRDYTPEQLTRMNTQAFMQGYLGNYDDEEAW